MHFPFSRIRKTAAVICMSGTLCASGFGAPVYSYASTARIAQASASVSLPGSLSQTKGWHVTSDGDVYYCVEDGKAVTGFQTIGGKTYYFSQDHFLERGWILDSGSLYYSIDHGDVGSRFGSLVSGWVKINKKTYYFSEEETPGEFGKMTDGWANIGGSVFYFEKGIRQSGLTKVDGKLYDLQADGAAGSRGRLLTGWQTIGKKVYYFRMDGQVGEEYGSAYTDCTVTIGRNVCTFSKKGVLSGMTVSESASVGTADSGAAGTGNGSESSLIEETETPETAASSQPAQKVVLTAAQQQFVETIGQLAHQDMLRSGVLASVTTAQAILESGWGTSELAKNARNLFGMKASLSGNNWASAWKGESYNIQTGEFIDGKSTTVSADFRAYDSVAESVADHSAYLTGAKLGNGTLRYAGLAGNKDYRASITIIKNGGYATSPTYISQLCGIIERYNLTRFD